MTAERARCPPHSGEGIIHTLLSSGTKWPALPDYFHDWALVDVETSGLRPGRDRVLSLAVLTLDAHGNRTGQFSTLLNPGCDPGPVHIQGLASARLAGAPTFEEIAPRAGALLSGRVRRTTSPTFPRRPARTAIRAG